MKPSLFFIVLVAAACGLVPAQAGVMLRAPNNLGLAQGLVGWWNFDGKTVSGTQVNDASGNGNRGTMTNGPITTNGKLGQAMEFDGEDDYVSATDNTLDFLVAGKTSWSVWINEDDFEDKNAFWSENESLDCRDGINHYAHTTADSSLGPVTAGISAGAYTDAAGASINIHSIDNVLQLGRWHHVVITYDGALSATNRLTIYVDGTDVTDRLADNFSHP
jgi:hypothetical protein